jgi:hypothetical protein
MLSEDLGKKMNILCNICQHVTAADTRDTVQSERGFKMLNTYVLFLDCVFLCSQTSCAIALCALSNPPIYFKRAYKVMIGLSTWKPSFSVL